MIPSTLALLVAVALTGALLPESDTLRVLPLPPQDEESVFDGQEMLDEIAARSETENWKEKEFGDIVGAVGMSLQGLPYTAGTLEGDREVCRVSLQGLDCVTFFESSVGIARLIVRGSELTAPNLVEEITGMRYRNGTVDGYTSRLHYFVDWVAENQRRGLVTDITGSLPKAEKDSRTINFMSTHVDAYEQLKSSPENQKKIRAIEAAINARERYWLPKRYIGETEKNLQTGDIVGITTSIAGLDVSHTGLCYRDSEGRLRLLHASSTKKKVLLDTDLDGYLAMNQKQTGIITVRPVAPGAQESSE